MSDSFTEDILGKSVEESPEQQIRREITPTQEELDAAKVNSIPDLLTPHEQDELYGPPQKGFKGDITTIQTDLLSGGQNEMKLKQIVTDVEKYGSILLQAAPTVLSILLPHSKATPIIEAIVPKIPAAMQAANVFLGLDSSGTTKQAAATALLASAVQMGQVVSATGSGQAHTMEEFQAALPQIQAMMTGVISALDGAASVITQPVVA